MPNSANRHWVTVGIVRVALAAVPPSIERKEERVLPGQPGGHVDFVGIDGKMHQCPVLESEQRLPRVTILLVLLLGVPDCLAGEAKCGTVAVIGRKAIIALGNVASVTSRTAVATNLDRAFMGPAPLGGIQHLPLTILARTAFRYHASFPGNGRRSTPGCWQSSEVRNHST